MGIVVRITEAEAVRDLAGMLERVRTQGAVFDIVRGEVVVARLGAAVSDEAPPKFGTMGALLEAMRKVPPLDPEDSLAFEKDLADIRKEFPMQNREWD